MTQPWPTIDINGGLGIPAFRVFRDINPITAGRWLNSRSFGWVSSQLYTVVRPFEIRNVFDARWSVGICIL